MVSESPDLWDGFETACRRVYRERALAKTEQATGIGEQPGVEICLSHDCDRTSAG